MENVIVLSDICKTYVSRNNIVYALKDLSMKVGKGEFVSITGKSGSGKSTLMNILGCLDTPTSGEYILDGIAVSKMSDRELSLVRNKVIGFIFQNFNLIPTLNALENVELPLIYRGIQKSARKQMALHALEKVGLGKRIMHKPCELSGGQQQRVAIARAVAAGPEIILADEPTGNLDVNSGNEIMDILKNLHKQGATIILITHDKRVAEMADRQVKISDGEIYLEF